METGRARIIQALSAKFRFIPFDNGEAALDTIVPYVVNGAMNEANSAFTNVTREQAAELRDTLTEWLGDSNKALLEFIAKTERAYFRTEHDLGANFHSLFIWNRVREMANLPKLDEADLTTADEYCDKTCDVISEREYPLMPRRESKYFQERG